MPKKTDKTVKFVDNKIKTIMVTINPLKGKITVVKNMKNATSKMDAINQIMVSDSNHSTDIEDNDYRMEKSP